VKNSLGSNWPQGTPTLNIEWGQIDPKGNRRVKIPLNELLWSPLLTARRPFCLLITSECVKHQTRGPPPPLTSSRRKLKAFSQSLLSFSVLSNPSRFTVWESKSFSINHVCPMLSCPITKIRWMYVCVFFLHTSRSSLAALLLPPSERRHPSLQ